jgi:eukaryotic-like serine/threonine-protein kinase
MADSIEVKNTGAVLVVGLIMAEAEWTGRWHFSWVTSLPRLLRSLLDTRLGAADAAGVRSTGPASDPPQIGRYQVIRHLATGGMAQIYLARMDGMASFERHVVLKTILANRANDRRFINMFLDEAKLAATLNHQNIAQVYEVDQADGAYFMAMEYVHGENCRAILETSIRRGVVIPFELAILIISGAAAGLHHAHERKGKTGQALNIVHRDVSPANIMVGYDGSVKVLDFGIAKAEERFTQTLGATIKGKYGYMSPEQCKGKGIDRRSDIFALGIVLYELTTQRRAFRGRDDFDTMKRIVASDLTLPSSLVPGYPSALEGIILKALSTDPDERYSDAQAMIEALDVFTQRSKLTCTNTAMARFMVQLFGEPREPWENVVVDGVRPGSSSSSESGSLEFSGVDDLRTTVLPGGSTLPPSSAIIPPRAVPSPLVPADHPPPPTRSRNPSVVDGRVQSPPPPRRAHPTSQPPPQRAHSTSQPPPQRAHSTSQPPPQRAHSTSQPPPQRAHSTSQPPPLPPRPVHAPVARRSLSPSASPSRLPEVVPPSSTTSPIPEALARAHTPSNPSRVVEVPAAGHSLRPRTPTDPPPGMSTAGPVFPMQARVITPGLAPLLRPTPSVPLSIPLVPPRTATPQGASPLLRRSHVDGVSVGTASDGSVLRSLDGEPLPRVHSSVMAPLPRLHNSPSLSAMTPLPRADGKSSMLAPLTHQQKEDTSSSGELRFKHRWVIVAVFVVVVIAVGLMIAIALISGPSP